MNSPPTRLHRPDAASPGLRPVRLHVRIGWWLGALVMGLALLLAALLDRSAERQIVALSASNLEALSEQVARELSEGMNRFSREITGQALRDRFRDSAVTVPEMRTALDEFKRLNPEFAYVAIVDAASARVLAATGGIFEGGSARGRPTFEEGLKGRFLGDVHDAVRLAELLPRPPGQETLRFLDVAAPVRDRSGQVIRVVAAHVGWHWTSEVVDRVFGPLKARRKVEAFLVDTRGKVVMSSARPVPVGTDLAALAGLSGRPADTVDWPDGGRYLTVVAETWPHGAFAGFGWKVIARQPAASAHAPIERLREAFLAAGLATGLAGAALAWLLARRLMSPLRRLADAAERVADGTHVGELPAAEDVGEFNAVQGAISRLAQTARDQTAATHTSERQFAVLAHALPQVVWQASAQGRIEYANRGWLAATAAAEVEDLADFVVGDARETFRSAWAASRSTGADLHVHCRLQAPGRDEARWCDIEARAVRADDGSVQRWIGTIFDVHELSLLGEKTRAALDEERAARAQAEQLARMRDDFIATASHELRSPLSAIVGWTDILARHGPGDAKVAQAAAVIGRNARQQAVLIDNLLDMSAVMGGRLVLNKAPLDVSRLATEVVQAHARQADERGLALSCGCGCEDELVVDADRARLAQALTNVLGNALKFTPRGGRVDVQVAVRDGHAELRVSDSGRGIGPDFLPHVFDPLRSEDTSLSRSAGGLGLGLAIARAIVTLHGGSIAAASDGPERGATFTLRLPLAEVPAADSPAVASSDTLVLDPQAHLQGMRVLLVDDEPDARDVAQMALAGLGADVTAVGSAAQALDRLVTPAFDVLVADIGMPEMDGLALIQRVRELPGARSLPAVALTAFTMPWQRQRALDAGFEGYVTKPLSLRRLYDAIVHAVGQRADAPG